MSESSPTPAPPVRRFTLNAAPPVRPLAIAAGAVVAGAVLLVLWRSFGLPAFVVVAGGVVMALGVALVVAALALVARLRTEVVLDTGGLTAVRGGRHRAVSWPDVSEVTMEHPRLSLVGPDGQPALVLVNPRKVDDPVFLALAGQIQQRLDTDRGYSPPPGQA